MSQRHRDLKWIIGFAIFAANAGAVAPALAEEANASNEKTLDVPDFLAVGLPSEWYRPFSPWDIVDRGRKWECVSFVVRSLRHDATSVTVTTTGIAGARLAGGGSVDGRTCDQNSTRTSLSLSHILQPTRQARAWLFVPANAFPLSSDPEKGALVIIPSTGEPISIEITLRRQQPSTVFQALQWLIGIVLPLLAGTTITYWFSLRQRRKERADEQNENFARFKTSKQKELTTFFGGLYHNIRSSGEKRPADKMLSELIEIGILNVLPSEYLKKIRMFATAGSWDKLDKWMAVAFPEHEKAIMKPKEA